MHSLVKGRKLIIGGVNIPYKKGLWAIQMGMFCCTLSRILYWCAALGDIGALPIRTKDTEAQTA